MLIRSGKWGIQYFILDFMGANIVHNFQASIVVVAPVICRNIIVSTKWRADNLSSSQSSSERP